MNLEQFTKNSIKALERAQGIAAEYGNPSITSLHLLFALTEEREGLIRQLLISMNVNGDELVRECKAEIERLPRVSGQSTGNAEAELGRVLQSAEDSAKKMGDSYVSVEHLMLGLIAKAERGAKKLLDAHGITEQGFLSALKHVRGNRRADSDNPEECYDAFA